MVKVLMFGWEFPPMNSGGLGTACYGITKSLAEKGVEVLFVMPQRAGDEINDEEMRIIGVNTKVKIRKVDSLLSAYMTSEAYKKALKGNASSIYGPTLFQEVKRFGEEAKKIAKEEEFDIIHSHDWMTYEAGLNAKKISKKPLVVHVHATELDRTGGNAVHQYVYDLERKGMTLADKVVTVSNYTKNLVQKHYAIPKEKIEVVHNAVEISNNIAASKLTKKDKVVLFLGRMTLQKGPDYFVKAAKKVLELDPDIKFIMAGHGDMEPKIIEEVAAQGIGDRVLFAGFLQGADIDKAYQLASLYVLPSVSEPFGITPLESLKNGTPVMVSRNSGVTEVLRNCMKVDFWDVDDMANKMYAALHYPALHEELRNNGVEEVKRLSWGKSASKLLNIYQRMIAKT